MLVRHGNFEISVSVRVATLAVLMMGAAGETHRSGKEKGAREGALSAKSAVRNRSGRALGE